MTLAAGQETLPRAVQDMTRAARLSPAKVDFERGEPTGEVKAYYQDAIKLPGFGHQPERCLPLTPVGFCNVAGHPILGRSSCQVRYCPKHWRDWLRRGVVAEVARLAAFRESQEGWGRRLVHGMLSPDQGRRWSADDVFDVRSSQVYDVAEAVGIRGGAVYPHAYRGSGRGKALFEIATDQGDFDIERGQWAFYRELADGDWEEMKDYIEAAPHYHTLAAVKDFDAEAAPEGWVAKNLRALSRFELDDLESYRDMAAVSYYLRTHGVSIEGRNSVTWFGDLHPGTFDPEEAVGSAKWAKIQEMAELAVTTKPNGEEIGGGVEGAECSWDDCEGTIVPIDQLAEWMDKRDWWASLPPENRNRLRALEQWWILQVDRPPPGRQGDREALVEWLTHRGRVITDAERLRTGEATLPGLLSDHAR